MCFVVVAATGNFSMSELLQDMSFNGSFEDNHDKSFSIKCDYVQEILFFTISINLV